MYDVLFSFGIIILLGILFRRLRIGGLDADSMRNAINVSVLNLFLPALCIKTIYVSKIDMETLLIPVTAWITTISCLLISTAAYSAAGKRMNITNQEKGILIISGAFGNVTYLGLPVLTGLFGEEAAKYALFYDLLATTPVLWLIGASFASRYGEGKRLELKESIKMVFSLPPIWGIIVGLTIKTTSVQLPYFIVKSLSMLGDVVVPLMIFSIGLALTIPKVQQTYIIIPAIIVKLVVSPFISYSTAFLLGIRGNALVSCLLEGAMPTMVLSLLIAARFKLDVSLSAFIIVTTTIASFFILPLAMSISRFIIH